MNTKPIPAANLCDYFTMEEFADCCDCNSITNWDGQGYYATTTEMTDIEVDCSLLVTGFSHVVWFNK